MSVDMVLDIKKTSVFMVLIVVGGLLSGNLFFVKRLVEELDENNQRSLLLQGKFAIFEYRLDRIEENLKTKGK